MAIKPPVIGNIVDEFYIDGTLIQVCDDAYRYKTPEEVQKVLDEISSLASRHLGTPVEIVKED